MGCGQIHLECNGFGLVHFRVSTDWALLRDVHVCNSGSDPFLTSLVFSWQRLERPAILVQDLAHQIL